MQFLYISQLRYYIIVMLFIHKQSNAHGKMTIRRFLPGIRSFYHEQTVNEVEMRILICDDDPLMIEQLKKFCKDFFDKIHVKCPE